MAICLTSEIFTGIAAHLLAVGLYTSLRTTCLPTPELTTYVQLFPQGQHHANLVWPLEPPPRLARTQSYSPPEDKRFSPTATWKQDYHHPHLLRGSPNRTRRLIGYRWYVQHVATRSQGSDRGVASQSADPGPATLFSSSCSQKILRSKAADGTVR
jgi:hypothetical protein